MTGLALCLEFRLERRPVDLLSLRIVTWAAQRRERLSLEADHLLQQTNSMLGRQILLYTQSCHVLAKWCSEGAFFYMTSYCLDDLVMSSSADSCKMQLQQWQMQAPGNKRKLHPRLEGLMSSGEGCILLGSPSWQKIITQTSAAESTRILYYPIHLDEVTTSRLPLIADCYSQYKPAAAAFLPLIGVVLPRVRAVRLCTAGEPMNTTGETKFCYAGPLQPLL